MDRNELSPLEWTSRAPWQPEYLVPGVLYNESQPIHVCNLAGARHNLLTSPETRGSDDARASAARLRLMLDAVNITTVAIEDAMRKAR